MTREEIMAMDAEQLRLAIAEARGEADRPHLGETWYEYAIETETGFDFADGWECPRCHSSGDGPCCPRYSTDIAAVWELVEEMDKEGLWQLCNGDGDSKDFQFIPVNQHFGKYVFVSDVTIPLAICHAWLLWKSQC